MAIRYKIGGREVTKAEWDAHKPTNPCDYEKGLIPHSRMGTDWSSENGGKGREITQLRDGPDAPKVYAKSPEQAAEIARRKDLGFEKT